MKKSSFFGIMILLALFAKAQNYKDISNNVLLSQYKPAKEDLDKKMTNEKFAAKPDAYILKTAIYAALASDSVTAQTPQGEQLLTDAVAAWDKYKQMDGAGLPLMADPIYQKERLTSIPHCSTKVIKNTRRQGGSNLTRILKN